MNAFEFAAATRIIFGGGTLKQAGALARQLGRKPLLVTGRRPERAEGLRTLLAQSELHSVVHAVSGEPDLATVEAGVSLARRGGCDLVVAFGGGSALDAGKAIAAMLTNEGELLDYLEVIGRGKSLTRRSAPLIAIPTTAGTGSEVTRNAVLASPVHLLKVSLRSALMLPTIALVDPELTASLPADVTASTGLDALTQLVEPFLSSRRNPMVDALCREGIPRVARSLRLAAQPDSPPHAREDMSLASLFGGLALANAGLGAVHGFAGPIGGMFPAPHGAVCAALLPHVLAANLQALRDREPQNEALSRFDELASLLTGKPGAAAEAAVEWVRQLVQALRIPKLRAYGITPEHHADLVEKASHASSMKANPLVLTKNELADILDKSR